MSRLLEYLEHHFPASLWEPQGVGDSADSDDTSPTTSESKNFRRKNHVKPGDITYFPDRKGSKWNEDSVKQLFMETFGVSVRVYLDDDHESSQEHSSHFLFKYYVILQAKKSWLEDQTGVLADCRGTIVQCIRNVGWRLAARPFEKFFNQQELACPVNDPSKFNENVKDYIFVEKADGTMMVLWYRWLRGGPASGAGVWQWSTSTGLIADPRWVRAVTPFFHIKYNSEKPPFKSTIAQDDTMQTDSTPDNTANHNFVDEQLLDINKTYVFELCSKETQVITRYPTERIFLLGSIHSQTGEVESLESLDKLAQRLNIMRPWKSTSGDVNIHNLKDALAWVEQQSSDPSAKYGEWPEGFVVYHNDRPICKLKNRAYNERHVFYANDLLHMRNAIIERYFAGTTDDVIQFCLPPIVAFIDEMKEKVENLMKSACEWSHKLLELKKTEMKDLNSEAKALGWVNLIRNQDGLQVNGLAKFFLKYKDDFISEHEPQESYIKEAFLAWLDTNTNWKMQMEYWKSSKVPEIVAEDAIREKERRPRGPKK